MIKFKRKCNLLIMFRFMIRGILLKKVLILVDIFRHIRTNSRLRPGSNKLATTMLHAPPRSWIREYVSTSCTYLLFLLERCMVPIVQLWGDLWLCKPTALIHHCNLSDWLVRVYSLFWKLYGEIWS
jgi:hypothetical protein